MLHHRRCENLQIAFDFVVVVVRTLGSAGLDCSMSEAAASAPWSSGTAAVADATGESSISRGWFCPHAALFSLDTVYGLQAKSTPSLMMMRLHQMRFESPG